MHTVTVTPTSVTLEPGGPAQVVDVEVSDVPTDVSTTHDIVVAVGPAVVTANLGVTIDHPSPTVTVSDGTGFTAAASTPVVDPADSSRWTFQVSFQA